MDLLTAAKTYRQVGDTDLAKNPEALPLNAFTTVGSADLITSSELITDEVDPC